MKYSQRAKLTDNPAAQKLFKLMDEKETNLAIAADVTTKTELVQIADELGPQICVLKTHIDIVDDFDKNLTSELTRLAKKHGFLIFEDRKFADIGNTVKYQYENGIYHIANWADIVNAHTVPGPGIIQGLKEVGLKRGRGLLLMAEMSSAGTLAQGDYTKQSIAMAEANQDFVIGFITTKKISENRAFINFTPGVKLADSGDTLGQIYQTPESAIKNGSDLIIVGRGIYQATDPIATAQKYRHAGWQTYLSSR